jgi:hypothetical protein
MQTSSSFASMSCLSAHSPFGVSALVAFLDPEQCILMEREKFYDAEFKGYGEGSTQSQEGSMQQTPRIIK